MAYVIPDRCIPPGLQKALHTMYTVKAPLGMVYGSQVFVLRGMSQAFGFWTLSIAPLGGRLRQHMTQQRAFIWDGLDVCPRISS